MRQDQLTLKQLRALKLVSEFGTISAAAQEMGLTAPAVHSQLKTLESAVGAALIVRQGKGRTLLTQQGAALVRAEGQMRATLRRALSEIRSLEEGHTGAVVIGAVSTAKYFAPRIVALLDRDFPKIDVSLRVSNRSDTIAGLARGEFDLCIMGRPPREPLSDAVELADHPHVLIAAPDHPLAGADRIEPEALASDRFILREGGSGTRLLAERFMGRFSSYGGAKRIEMDSNETIKQAVMSGLGVALISAHTVSNEVHDGRLVVLNAVRTPIVRKWYLLSAREFEPTPAARVVGDWIQANCQRCLPDPLPKA